MLQLQRPIILDGAMGTELERRGIVLNNTRLWSSQLLIDDPAVVRDIHRDYYLAGAQVVTTATYQASLGGFESAGVGREEAAEKVRLAVTLADEARRQAWAELSHTQAELHTRNEEGHQHQQQPGPCPLLVGFSCGAYGACLCDGSEFTGAYAEKVTQQQLAEWHRWRMELGAQDPRVDVLAFETIPSAKEVAAVAQLLKEREAQAAAPGQDNPAIQQPLQMGPGPAGQGIENNTVHERVCPAWVSVSCKDSSHTCAGDSFAEDVVPLLWGCDSVIGIGINCTAPQHVSALLAAGAAKLKQLTEQDQDGGSGRRTGPPPFLLCYPNSGEGWDGEHRCWLPDADGGSTPGGFAAKAAEWVKAGAAAVGGCCRTGPAHIQELKRILKATSSTCAS